jgi:hypothetical protein
MTDKPSMIPKIAIRTMSLEKVLLEFKVIRLAIKRGKFKPDMDFMYLRKDAIF